MKRTWPERLFAALVPDGYADQFFADLEEEYEILVVSHGASFARRWYLGQLVRSLPSLVAHELGGGGKLNNYLAAGLRNLARNRLYAGINIAGLAVGFAAAILIALFVRDEFSYDHFIPGHDDIYVVGHHSTSAQSEYTSDYWSRFVDVASWKLDFPTIAAARLAFDRVSIRRGDTEAEEKIAWVDPEFFSLMPLPATAGDPYTALQHPDNVVLTRKMARKYFGRDDPLGEMLELDRQHPMRVGAVIDDFPASTHLTQEIFASSTAAFSPQALAGPQGASITRHTSDGRTTTTVYRGRIYLRIPPQRVTEIERALPDFFTRHIMKQPPGILIALSIIPLDTLHLYPFTETMDPDEPRGNAGAITALPTVAALILLIAFINFVNLMTARATRRAVEVGIRKVSGAMRHDLIVQFIGESLVYVTLGVIIAMALVELCLPSFNAFFDRTIVFDFWRDLSLAGGLIGTTILVGILAGAYPALVLSAFPPAVVLKGGVLQMGGSGLIRQILVIFQFAILIGLIVSTAVIYRQTQFAMNEGLRFNKDQVLQVEMSGQESCRGAFVDQVRSLPSVRAVGCSAQVLMGGLDNRQEGASVLTSGGVEIPTTWGVIDAGFFSVYGIEPLAGRLFSPDRPADMMSPYIRGAARQGPMVINKTLANELGFANAADAIGSTATVPDPRGAPWHMEIVGVVPDFALVIADSKPVLPTIYTEDLYDFPWETLLHVKLSGGDIPETLAAIDGLWKQFGEPRPIRRRFLDQYLQNLYVGVIRQGALIGGLAGIAVFIACLGLFGLAAFTAERRTKEIGIRKAMGANRWDIVKLLVWQFTKPVLLANLIAWPVGYYFMNRWLHRFAYHIDLSFWIFLAAGASALIVALATVSIHAFIIAGARPVTALRYE